MKSSNFPFLDMKMTWSVDGDLWFGVNLKPGKELKYLNSNITYPPHCFKCITRGVFGNLASSILLTRESRYMSIKDIYPRYHKALDSAGLSPKYAPTLQELLAKNNGNVKRRN
jgi:hypothetical protein